MLRGYLVYFYFYHSSLLIQFSSLITHYLKYPNFLYSPVWHTSLNFSSLNFSTFLWDTYLSTMLGHGQPTHVTYIHLSPLAHIFFPFSSHILLEPSTNPMKPPAQSSPSSSATASSLSSSSTASSSSAWSPFAPMVSSKLLAWWGKDEICGFLGSLFASMDLSLLLFLFLFL